MESRNEKIWKVAAFIVKCEGGAGCLMFYTRSDQSHHSLELATEVHRDFTITETTPTKTFSGLKAPFIDL